MKTVTMRVDDSTYNMIKLAAEGQRRNLSNFIEFVEKDEMAEILEDKDLVENLMNGLEDFKKGDYTIV
ncbi:MAG: CopG family transcriptional regulator [Helicobacteraceae bacterium]|nr:CopG family transcriptional regulator [Helicobacteraceae bacterium]